MASGLKSGAEGTDEAARSEKLVHCFVRGTGQLKWSEVVLHADVQPQVLPEIIELWGLNVQTQVESKKNFERLTGK